jgi:competence protein ComEA
VRLFPSPRDDADVIRARLRALLADRDQRGGWIPGEITGEDFPGEGVDGDYPRSDDLGVHGGIGLAPHGGVGLAPHGGVPGIESWGTTPIGLAIDESALPPGIGRHRAPGPAVRVDPGRWGAWSLWAAGLAAATVLAAWTWLDRPRVEPIPPAAHAATAAVGSRSPSTPPTPSVGEAAETSATVVVSVVGLVGRPGLVTLTSGARVADAIAAAGGLLPGASGASVNLAAVVSDGEQIAVGVPAAPGAAADTGASPSGPPGRVNLNTATAGDLDGLPGIGPVLAQRIVDYREQQGPFTSVDQLDDVPGIGPAIFAELTKRVTV